MALGNGFASLSSELDARETGRVFSETINFIEQSETLTLDSKVVELQAVPDKNEHGDNLAVLSRSALKIYQVGEAGPDIAVAGFDYAQDMTVLDVDLDGTFDIITADAHRDELAWFRNNEGRFDKYVVSTNADFITAAGEGSGW